MIYEKLMKVKLQRVANDVPRIISDVSLFGNTLCLEQMQSAKISMLGNS